MTHDRPAVRLILDLSTAHLPATDRDDLNGVDGVLAYRMQHGWLMWAPDDPDESASVEMDPPPEWVLVIQRYAREHGCDYVMFDSDARVDPALPWWDV